MMMYAYICSLSKVMSTVYWQRYYLKSKIANRGNTAGKQEKYRRKPLKHRGKHAEIPGETVGDSLETGET